MRRRLEAGRCSAFLGSAHGGGRCLTAVPLASPCQKLLFSPWSPSLRPHLLSTAPVSDFEGIAVVGWRPAGGGA